MVEQEVNIENVPTSRFADEATKLDLSKTLGRIELTATELEFIEQNAYDVLYGKLDRRGGGRFSVEATIRVQRQVEYFLSVAHLESDAHARNLFESNGMGFYVKDFMKLARMASVTEMELISVCESFRNDDRYSWDDVYIYVSDDDDWEDFADEEKASADLKELLVMSIPCARYVKSSKAATKNRALSRTEL